MPRMYGESQRDWEARRNFQQERRRATEEWKQRPRVAVLISVQCNCSEKPWPHPAHREDPRDFRRRPWWHTKAA